MRKPLSRAALAALAALAMLAAAAVASDRAAAQALMRVVVDGSDRTAKVHGLKKDAAPRPLVIALHGWSGSADQMSQSFAMNPIADREDFIVAYPDGIARTWNYGTPLGPDEKLALAGGKPVDDVAFLRAVIARLVDRGQVDRTRIYLTGSSYGGMMVFAAACAMGDELAAVAPLITGMSGQQRDDCRPGRDLPMLLLAGTKDTVQTYGGENEGRTPLLSAADTFAFWRARNGCGAVSEAALAKRDASDPTAVFAVRSLACRGGAEVLFYRVEGGGHTLPSLVQPPREGRNRDVETAEVVWDFFKRFRRE